MILFYLTIAYILFVLWVMLPISRPDRFPDLVELLKSRSGFISTLEIAQHYMTPAIDEMTRDEKFDWSVELATVLHDLADEGWMRRAYMVDGHVVFSLEEIADDKKFNQDIWPGYVVL